MRILAHVTAAALAAGVQQKPQAPTAKPSPPARPFENPYSPAELRNKQAVIETSEGTIVLDLLPEGAPNHVAHFIATAREGGYDGTT